MFGESDLNQTDFISKHPLFEDPSVPQRSAALQAAARKPRTLAFVVAGIGIVLAIGSLALLAVLNMPQTQAPMTVEVSPSPVVTAELTPLQKKIRELQSEIAEADPTKELLPFPPVDLELRLEKAKR